MMRNDPFYTGCNTEILQANSEYEPGMAAGKQKHTVYITGK